MWNIDIFSTSGYLSRSTLRVFMKLARPKGGLGISIIKMKKIVLHVLAALLVPSYYGSQQK